MANNVAGTAELAEAGCPEEVSLCDHGSGDTCPSVPALLTDAGKASCQPPAGMRGEASRPRAWSVWFLPIHSLRDSSTHRDRRGQRSAGSDAGAAGAVLEAQGLSQISPPCSTPPRPAEDLFV